MSLTLPLVLITNAVPDEVLAPLAGIARIVLGPANGDLMPRADVLRLAPDLAGIVNQAELRVDSEFLDRAPRLRVVANVSIGVNNLDLTLMQRRGIYATNVPHAFIDSTADFTLGLLLAVARKIPEADAYVRAGAWRSFQPGVWDGALLKGKILGLVGYGAIGQAVAVRARSFGLRILFYQRTRVDHPDYAPLDDLLQAADIVSLHLPLNDDSERLISATGFARMKRGALFINASRGRIVDESALVDALLSGHLAGAGLDVFENEPEVHLALRTMPNVVLTPHIGGGTRESRHQARYHCVNDVARVLRGQRPLTPLNAPEDRSIGLIPQTGERQ